MTGPRKSGPARKPVPEAWSRWLAIYSAECEAAMLAQGTIELRRYHLSALARALPDTSPLAITRDDLIGYMSRQNWTPNMARSNRTTFRMFWRLLHEQGHRVDDPARTLPRIRVPRAMPRPAPDVCVERAFETTADLPVVNLALWINSDVGLRRSEVARVRRTDVEGRPGEYFLHVVGKGGHERSVPIADSLADTILNSAGEFVFPSRDGGHLSPAHLGKKISEALGDGFASHSLRHRFATVAYQGSTDLRAVQELLGHSSPTTTAIYTKVADGAMRDAAFAAHVMPRMREQGFPAHGGDVN